jgi:high-affinity iron transporter
MIPASIISFRETLEMFLIIFSFIAYVNKTGLKSLMKSIYAGVISGILSGLLLGSAIFISTNTLTGYSGEIFEGSMLLFTSIIMGFGIILMSKQSNNYDNNSIEKRYNFKSTSASIFLIIFLTSFREILEVSIYTLPLLKEDILSTLIADALGLLVSFCLMILLYKTTVKLNISLILKILTFFLIYVSADLFGEALEKLFPQIEGINFSGMLLYGIPLFFIFLKNQIKVYIKKKNN